MAEVRAPHPFAQLPRPWVFLAGSIEGGRAWDWQAHVVAALLSTRATLLNPRRDDWDGSWREEIGDPQFRAQVEWELEGQELSDLILMCFAPDTRSPVTLLELGLFARSGKLVVCCPEGFWRKGNVDVVCHRYGVPQVGTLEELVLHARAALQAARP